MRCPSPRYVWPKGKVIAVPCGKCLICLQNKRYDWGFRLMQEYKVSLCAHFATFTYTDKYLPESGLNKRHLQLYFKRLRKVCPRLRYYAVGEYGSKTGRTHYHAVIYNCDEKNIRKHWSLKNLRTDKWEPIGIVHLEPVNEKTVAYVLKYIIQKDDFPDGKNPPFAIMSRAYGLGLSYLTDEMVAWHRSAERVYTIRYGEKGRLARYYKDKIWPTGEYKTGKGEDKRYWSDWFYRREMVNKKALLEAEKREEKEIKTLKEMGYDPEDIRLQMREAVISRIKSKIAYTQKF